MVDLAKIGYQVDTRPLKDGERALESFGRAHRTTMAHVDAATTASARYRKAMIDANQAISATQGPVRQVTSQLGSMIPILGRVGIGFGVAGGIVGGFAVAVHAAVAASLALADRAGRMVDFAETTGLSTDALQALHKAASQVGLTADAVSQNIERFTAQFALLRRSSGEVYDQILEINPALARQMSLARSSAEAYDLLNRAIAQANELDRVRLARAAFGRGGTGMVRVANYAEERGGLQGLIAGMDAADVRTAQFLRRLDEVADQSRYSWDKAKENFVALFALPVTTALDYVTTKALELSRVVFRGITDAGSAPTRITVNPATGGYSQPAPAAEDPRTATIRNYNEMSRWMQVIGPAATLTQQFELRQRALAAAMAEGKVNAEQYGQALRHANLEAVVQQEQRRFSILGDLVSVESIVIAKQNEINMARMAGVRITREEAEALLIRTRIQAEAARIEDQLGFERSQMFRSSTDQRIAETLRMQGIGSETARGNAVADMIRMNEQLRLGKDLATEFATGFTRDVIGELRNGANAWEAFAKAGINALNRLVDRLIEIAASRLVQQAFGGLAGSGINFGTPTADGRGLTGVAPYAHSGGLVGSTNFPTRYVHSAYFDDAPRFARGSLPGTIGGDEIPIIAHRGEVIGWPAQMRQAFGGSDVQINIENHSGGEVAQSERQGSDGSRIVDIVIGRVKEEYAKGGFDSVHRARFGGSPSTRRA